MRRFSFSTLSVLHTLSRRGPLRVTDLTATEQLKQPALTSLVAKLERDGLVSRRGDPRDADRMTRLSRLAGQLNDQERDGLAGYARLLARLAEIAAADGA